MLIIEDNRDYGSGLKLVFELRGHTVSLEYDGAAGIAAALREPPEVVICDLGLPGVDGFEVARALRQHPLTARAFLVAVTGYGSDADRERALAS
ncbi:MAG TPA: response regulator, partial [Armatimonadota bacterium]|nr:response regulator [Armatimonadota bacterium]